MLQKLLNYFNSTATSKSFILLLLGVFPVIFTFDLNDSEVFITVSSGSDL